MSNNTPDLARIMAMLGQGDDDASEITLDPSRAVEIIRGGYDVLQVNHDLTAGQIVRNKPGVEDGYKKPNGGLLLFVRDFTEQDRENNNRAVDNMSVSNDMSYTLRSRDCVVLRVLDDGAVLEFPVTKRCLEPHPDFAA